MCVYPFSVRRVFVSSLFAGAALLFLSAGVRADEVKTVPVLTAPAVDFRIKTSPYRPMSGGKAVLTATLKPLTPLAPKEKSVLTGLFYVREDLGQLFVGAPAIQEDGSFEDSVTLPSGGEWRVFGSMITQTDEGEIIGKESVLGPTKLEIDGARTVRESLIPQMQPSVRVSNYILTLKQPLRITTGEEQNLVFTLLDGQTQQVSDMDIWREALAHLILVDKDVKTLLHVMPDPTDPRTGRTGTLVFPTRFPKSGIWRGWVLFHRNAQVITMPIVLRVLGR